MNKAERGKWKNAGSQLGIEPRADSQWLPAFCHFPLLALFVEFSVYFQCEARSAENTYVLSVFTKFAFSVFVSTC